MFTNETKVIQLPVPQDQDEDDNPVISSFVIDSTSNLGSQFITYDNSTRKIAINPESKDTFAGTFNLKITVDDLRQK
jgi:hypothetical protein